MKKEIYSEFLCVLVLAELAEKTRKIAVAAAHPSPGQRVLCK